MTSNDVIIKKSEKQYVRRQLSIPGTKGGFYPDIDGFTNEPLVQ